MICDVTTDPAIPDSQLQVAILFDAVIAQIGDVDVASVVRLNLTVRFLVFFFFLLFLLLLLLCHLVAPLFGIELELFLIDGGAADAARSPEIGRDRVEVEEHLTRRVMDDPNAAAGR